MTGIGGCWTFGEDWWSRGLRLAGRGEPGEGLKWPGEVCQRLPSFGWFWEQNQTKGWQLVYVKQGRETGGVAAQEKEKVFFFLQGVAVCGCLGEWGERVRVLGFFVI